MSNGLPNEENEASGRLCQDVWDDEQAKRIAFRDKDIHTGIAISPSSPISRFALAPFWLLPLWCPAAECFS